MRGIWTRSGILDSVALVPAVGRRRARTPQVKPTPARARFCVGTTENSSFRATVDYLSAVGSRYDPRSHRYVQDEVAAAPRISRRGADRMLSQSGELAER